MSAIAKAIGPLVNIALLLLFAIIIFAIVGLEFYAGALNKTCYDINNLRECFIYCYHNHDHDHDDDHHHICRPDLDRG